jgi:hypothetical protein
VRAGRAEKKAARKAAKKLLRSLLPGARGARGVMEPGDECLAFMPDGSMVHMRLEDEVRFRVRQLENLNDAVDVGVKWAREERAAEGVQ